MADEQQEQPEQQAAAPEQTDEEFDWGSFFAEDSPDSEATITASVVEDERQEDEDSDLRAQLAQAQADSKRALELAMQTQTQSRMQGAIDAWKAQATPAEQQLAGLLMKSKTPEELQENARIVKEAAATMGNAYEQQRAKDKREMEMQMQKEFGIPVPPTFQPMPEEEKVNELLKAGDLDGAAAAMLKGVFNS